MGCNQTKSEDINTASRERLGGDQGKPGRTPTTPISSPTKTGVLDDTQLGKSYSEKRELESESLLTNIIERAERDLIDVGTTTTLDDDMRMSERRDMKSAAEDLVKTVKIPVGLFAIPTPSTIGASATTLLGVEGPATADLEFIDSSCSRVCSALEGMTVHDCGELIVGFGTPIAV